MDILKDKWSPALQIRTVLLSIQALLSAPEPDDPLDTRVADHFKHNRQDAELMGEFSRQLDAQPRRTQLFGLMCLGMDSTWMRAGLFFSVSLQVRCWLCTRKHSGKE